MSKNTDDGKKKTKIWITLGVVMGLICLGFFAWLLWRFKGKLKGNIVILCLMNHFVLYLYTVSQC